MVDGLEIEEVDGRSCAQILRNLNSLAPDRFPPLQARHFELGFWWLARGSRRVVAGFAGMVPMVPFAGVGYLKRAYVLPEFRGRGLQLRFMVTREIKARQLGWSMLVSECADNPHSETNFKRAGYEQFDPEQPWGAARSVFFVKVLK